MPRAAMSHKLGDRTWTLTVRWDGRRKCYWVIASSVDGRGRIGLPLLQPLVNEVRPPLDRNAMTMLLRALADEYAKWCC